MGRNRHPLGGRVKGSFKGVAGKFHGSFKRISRSFQGCFKGASKLFQGCVKCVSIKFHGSFKELLMVSVSRNILRVFQCSFKGISKKLRRKCLSRMFLKAV